MRLYEVTDPDYMNMVRRDCKPFLEQSGDKKVYRGIRKNYSEVFFKVTVRQDRKPLSFNSVEHALLIDAFEKGGFTANRNNSMFCTGSLRHAKSYGTAYEVYPIGDFSFTWSPKIRDLFTTWYEFVRTYPVKHIFRDDLKLKDTQFARAAQFDNRKDMLMKDYAEKYFNGAYYELDDRTPHKIEFPDLPNLIKGLYKSDDLKTAIENGNELMIACKEAYMIKV